MPTINPELLNMAQARFVKRAAVIPGAGPQDSSAMGGQPPMDPAAAAAGAMPADPSAMAMGQMPTDPAAMGAAAPAAPVDPAAAMAAMQVGVGAPPAPAAPPPAPPTTSGQQKLKPEQMMQMLDYRLYNMQQQLTAIINAIGAQVAPESLVLPPGTTGAPPAETALPGGPMAPPAPQPADSGSPPTAKAAWWQSVVEEANGDRPSRTQLRAAAVAELYNNRYRNEN